MILNVNIDLLDSQLPPDISNLKKTSWELAIFNDFGVENYILGRSLENVTETKSISMPISNAKLVNKTIYYRVKFHFDDIGSEKWSDTYTHTIDDVTLPTVQALIKVPEIAGEIFYTRENGENKGFVKFVGTDYDDINEKTSHNKSYWGVTNTSGSGIVSEIVTVGSETEEIGLNYIILPIDIFQDDDIYTVTLRYESNTAIGSGISSHKFETYTADGYIKHDVVDNVTIGKIAYFDVTPQTTDFKSISLALKDIDDNVVAELANQETIYPKLMIPTDLDETKAYQLEGKITKTSGFVSDYERMELLKIDSNSIRDIDPNVNYLEKFTDMGTLENIGISVTNGVEVGEGKLLIANSKNKTVDMYNMVDEKLVFEKIAIALPTDLNIGIVYLNIVKRYDGKIVINYATNNKLSSSASMAFKLYEYNPAENKFELNNSAVMNNVNFSTAISSTMFVAPNNDVYFIPAGRMGTGLIKDNISLAIFKLDGVNFDISTSYGLLPYDLFNIRRFLSMAPTSDPEKFIIFGGCVNEFIIDGKHEWERENDSIWLFDTTKPIGGLSLIEGVDLSGISKEYYNLVGYLRKDGKIAIFNNNTRKGFERQEVYTLDLEAKTIVSVPNIDSLADYRFRNTIALNNGEFIRFSTSVNSSEKVHRFVADSISEVKEIDGGMAVQDLYVDENDEVVIDDIHNYRLIKIKGTNADNSGKLVITGEAHNGIYDYRTLFVIGDVTITQEDNENVEQIIAVNGSVTISD